MVNNTQHIETSIILSNENIDEFNVNNTTYEHNNNNNIYHFRGKCGEICLENGKYLINCNFCNINFIDIPSLITHIYYEHFKLKPPHTIEHLIEDDSGIDQPNQQQSTTPPKQILQNNDILNNTNIMEEINDTTNDEFINNIEIDYKILTNNDTTNDEFINNIETDSQINDNDNKEKEIINYKNNNKIDNCYNYELDICEIPNKAKDKYGLYSCEYCIRSYIYYIHLKYHYLEHNYPDEFHKLPIRKKICNDKNKYFINIDDKIQYQLDQMKRKPDDDGKFYCGICTKKFTQFRYYRTHYYQVHQKFANPYKCEYCPMTFITRQTWMIHERTHTGERPHQCPYCSRAFALDQNLKRHINIHLGEKPYSCTYCDKKFTQPQSRNSHERNIHTKERPHQCELCGVTYPRLILLKEHYKRHTNTRPFECNLCHKKYYDNASLKIHLNTHTGERIYECKICFKKFKNVKCLKSHRKIHSNVKKYQCKICDETFTQNAGLYSHMKVYHDRIIKTEEAEDTE